MYSQPQQIRIAWPARALFNFLCDIDSHSQWRQGLKLAEWLSANRHTVGALYAETFQRTELPARQVEIIAHEAARLREVSYREGNVEYRVLWQFFADGDSTLLHYSVKVNCPPLVKWTESFLTERALKELSSDLQRAKEMLEAEEVSIESTSVIKKF